MVTSEEFAAMTPEEKAILYAKDVVVTKKELQKDGVIWYYYDFLFRAGSLGYQRRPSPIGSAVRKIANILQLTVEWDKKSSGAKFNGEITDEAVKEAFLSIFEESERMKVNADNK